MELYSFLFWAPSCLDLEILEEMAYPGHDLDFSTIHLTFLDQVSGQRRAKQRKIVLLTEDDVKW